MKYTKKVLINGELVINSPNCELEKCTNWLFSAYDKLSKLEKATDMINEEVFIYRDEIVLAIYRDDVLVNQTTYSIYHDLTKKINYHEF